MRKIVHLSAACALLTSALSLLHAETPRHALKSNYQINYNVGAQKVESFGDMFSQGEFFGRLRSNNFFYNWEKEGGKQENHITNGIGGSLVYKSASFADFDFGGALYYSEGFTTVDKQNAGNMKPGQDVMSRFLYSNTDTTSLGVLGQAYLSYSGIKDTKITLGRQLVETFYTKSNDTKMIPNTFDGVVVETKALEETAIKVGYLIQQKLRAHADAHSVLMYGDANSSASLNPQWDENDDSAMHKGLTYSRLTAAGKPTKSPLIVADIHNKSIKNLRLDASLYAVPELVSQGMLEANYKIDLGSGATITPGLRYIQQFDNGAGEIGGSSYSGKLAGMSGSAFGYKDAASLDSAMLGARVVGEYKNFKLNLGYTNVFDEADLITPWRGFPTAGYTRSMARYNWMANTKSYRAELMINNNKSGVYTDVMMQLSVLHTDADESKGYADENYYYAGFVQNLPFHQAAQWRFRLGYQDTEKIDADSVDTRLELNYLF